MKKSMRQIVIDGKVYLWRFTPGYVKIDDSPGHWECQDRFLAYLQSARNSPLYVHFRTWEDPTIGGPLHVGSPLDLADPGSSEINLHTSGWAAWLIRQALEAGWAPEQSAQPFVIEQGVQFFMVRMTGNDL